MSAAAAEGADATEESPEQIQERLAAQRRELSQSVDALASRVDPRTQARQAADDVRDRARTQVDGLRSQVEELRERARQTVDRAQEGDPQALGIVAAVAGGAVAAGLALGALIRR